MSLARHRRRSLRATAAALVVLFGAAIGAVGVAFASPEGSAGDAGAVQSEARATVILDESGCLSVSQPELRRLAGIELGPLLVPPPSQTEPEEALDVARLTLICDATRAVIRVRSRASGASARAADVRTIEREVSLADFPADAVARGLTLASIELLATLETTVRAKLTGDRAPAAPPTQASPAASSLSIAVVGLRREFFGGVGLGAWGGRVDLLRDSGRLRITGDLEVDVSGTTPSALGDARALLGSVAGFAGGRFAPARNVVLSLSAGARGGVARLQGVPLGDAGAVGSTIWRPWWGPALSARATVGGARLAALASIELGITASGAEALSGTATVLAVRGAWLTAAAGAEF